MKPLRVVAWIAGVLVSFALVVTIIGAAMPREHVAASAVTLPQPVDSVWAVLRDFAGMPAWWPEMTSSARVDGAAGERWRQNMGGMEMSIDVVEDTPPTRLVTHIVEEAGAPFGGTWTYVLAPHGPGTRVTVTERGWIGPPPFRVMAAVFGLHSTLDGLLVALGRRFGATVTPEHVD